MGLFDDLIPEADGGVATLPISELGARPAGISFDDLIPNAKPSVSFDDLIPKSSPPASAGTSSSPSPAIQQEIDNATAQQKMERDAFDPGGAGSNFGEAFAGAATRTLGTIAKSPIGQGFAAVGSSGGGFAPAADAYVSMSDPNRRPAAASGAAEMGARLQTTGTEMLGKVPEGAARTAGEIVGGLAPYVAAEATGGLFLTLPMLFGEGFQRHIDDAEVAAKKRGDTDDTLKMSDLERQVAGLPPKQDVTRAALAGGALNLALGLPIFKVVKGIAHAVVPNAARSVQDTIHKIYRAQGMEGVERLTSALSSAAEAGAEWTPGHAKALEGALRSIDSEIQAPATAALRRVLSQSAQSAAVGGAVTTGHNLLAQNYDPDRPSFHGVPEALATFGALGAIGATGREGGKVRSAREAQEWLRQKYHEKPVGSDGSEPTAMAPAARSQPLKSFQQLQARAEQPAEMPAVSAEAEMNARIAAAQPLSQDPAPLTPSEPPTGEEIAPGETLLASPGIVTNVPMRAVAVRPALMQFKQSDDLGSGTNKHDRIDTPYDPLKAGVTLLWEPADPDHYGLAPGEKFIVVNGHHRDELRRRHQVEKFNAQILREANGVSVLDARRTGAEINIADGKGTIHDQANFIRDTAAVAGPNVALERARALGSRARKPANIGLAATDDLYAAFINERVSPEHAEAIALAAPLQPGLQRVGLAEALNGASPQDAGNVIEAVKASLGAEPSPEQVDLFGRDDAALNASRQIAHRAGAVQREISAQIASVQGAARRPEKARQLGVNVADPASVQSKIAALQQARERWRHWGRDPAMLTLLRGGNTPAQIASADMSAALPRLRAGEAQGDLLQGADQPFNLAGETGVDYQARASEAAAADGARAEAAAARDTAQSDLFGRAGIEGSEGGFISADGFEALLSAGHRLYLKGMEFAVWAGRMVQRFGQRVREFLHHVWRSLTGQDVLPHASERGSIDISRPSIRVGSKRDGYRDVPLRHLDKIPIADLPALVNLTRELGMDVPTLKRLPKARGYFAAGPGSDYHIVLDPRLFTDAAVAAKVLAHELGHAGDYLPDSTLKRGNLLGRLATLKNYLVATLPIEPGSGAAALTKQDRGRLRLAAQRAIGPKPPKTTPRAEQEAWTTAVADRYLELVNAELQRQGLAADRPRDSKTSNNVREELVALSDWWKPYLDDAAAGALTDSHIAYRESGVELYADMISVLLNSPRDVRERAPTAFKMFFSYLDRKPEVRSAFFEMWDMLGPDVDRRMAARRQRLHDMFTSGEELLNKKIEERARNTSWQEWMGAMRTGLDTRYWSAIRRERAAAKAGDPVAKLRPLEWLFDAHPLSDNDVYVWMQRANDAVREPLLAAGLSERDLGEYLFLDRVANESYAVSEQLAAQLENDHGGRAHLANPEGHTPQSAREQLAFMELQLGAANFAKVLAAAATKRAMFAIVTQRMRDEGMISAEAWAIIDQNRGHYATFMPLIYADLHVPAGIKQQMGYLGEIANPDTAMTLKAITALRAIQFNRAKRTTIEHLAQYFPDEITAAPTKWDGRRQKPQEPRDQSLALVTFVRDGKLQGVHAPKDIAEMLEYTESALVDVLHKMLSPMEWLWQQVFYPSYITFSPLFQLARNPIRDIRRTGLNLPDDVGMHQAILTRWGETRRMVKEWVKEGKMHPDILDALEARALPPPMGTWQRQMAGEDMFITIAGRFGLARPGTVKEGHWVERLPYVGKLFRAMAVAGQVRELVPKLGAYRLLTHELGYSAEDAAGYVRNWIGTPNFVKKGTWSRLANDIFPFQNVWQKGWQADARLMRGRSEVPSGRKPKSAASWWLRWLLTGAVPKVLMAAGAAGLFGETLRRLYGRVGGYWMQNYDVIPLGDMPGGAVDGRKTVFIPIPQDFTSRILGGLVYLVSRASFDAMQGNKQAVRPSDAIALGTSDMPGVNPMLKIATGWSTYLSGGNPYDSFRNAHVLTQQQEDAGARFTIGPMLNWTMSQAGVSTFMSWNGAAGTTTEQVLSGSPVASGMIKWSDAGLRQSSESAEQEQRGERARIVLSMPAEVQQLRTEYNWLKGVRADRRTPKMDNRYLELTEWNSEVYQPLFEAAQMNPDAASLRTKGAIVLQYSQPYLRRK